VKDNISDRMKCRTFGMDDDFMATGSLWPERVARVNRPARCHRASPRPLFPQKLQLLFDILKCRMADVFALDQVDHVFADIIGVITDPL